jgi:transcriptional regulator
MYIPKHFKVTDWKEIKAFINENSFGAIINTEDGRPVATHLPFQLQQEGDDFLLTSHFAKANPQWKSIESGNNQVLLIFQGPHAYVSSSWYKAEEVPTWNYQSVHIYGKAEIMTEQELEEDLTLLLEKYEKHRENPVLWEKLSDQTKKQIRGIMGVKIKIDEVQAAYKLSQNRKEEDYQNVIHRLLEANDADAKQVGKAMQKRDGLQ